MQAPSSTPIYTSFIEYLRFEKRYSRYTVNSYEDDLSQFFQFICSEYGDLALKDINSSMIRSWLASLKDNARSPKSINRKASALKSFFKYHLKLGNVDVSPVAGISTPKAGKRLPSFVLEEEMEKLLENVSQIEGWEGKTTSLIVELLYATGMRIGELINLKETNINSNTSSIKVFGKGSKYRLIPVNKSMMDLLMQYKADKRHQAVEVDTDYLFVTPKGKRLYPKYVYLRVHKFMAQVTTMERKSPHILRHTFATHLTNNGADINAIKELLGHSSLASTQIYTHNSIEKLMETYKKAHPKA